MPDILKMLQGILRCNQIMHRAIDLISVVVMLCFILMTLPCLVKFGVNQFHQVWMQIHGLQIWTQSKILL